MYILGLDVETTGLDPEDDKIIEIGAVLWDTETNQPLKLYSELIREEENVEVPDFIEELTGISTANVAEFGLSPDEALFQELDFLMEKATHFVAHNASFDKGFLEDFYQRHGKEMPAKPWVCTIQDVEYPKAMKQKNLTYLAAMHGFLNPFSHRAVTDVLTMLRVLGNYDFATIASLAACPTLEVVAKVSYDDRNLAKDAGFRWDGASKQWKLQIKEPQFDPTKYSFAVEVLSRS